MSSSRTLLFFFNDTATTEIYTLSLHDALPIYTVNACAPRKGHGKTPRKTQPERYNWLKPTDSGGRAIRTGRQNRSEEHTSELQSRQYLVCRLLLEKKKSSSRKSAMHSDHRHPE